MTKSVRSCLERAHLIQIKIPGRALRKIDQSQMKFGALLMPSNPPEQSTRDGQRGGLNDMAFKFNRNYSAKKQKNSLTGFYAKLALFYKLWAPALDAYSNSYQRYAERMNA
jgi:hypothetical protein